MDGYNLTFVQKRECKDDTKHLYTLIYSFYSPITTHKYVVLAQYYSCDVFAVKFYSKRHKKSERKYSIVTNCGDIFKIIQTCIDLVVKLINDNPRSSFGFIASRTIDKSKRVEPIENNQRYLVYKRYFARIGSEIFDHFEFDNASAYLLINKKSSTQTTDLKNSITNMFKETYPDLLEL